MKVTFAVYFPLFRKFFERTISMPLPPVKGMQIDTAGLLFEVDGVRYNEADDQSDEVIYATGIQLWTERRFKEEFPEGLKGWTEYNY